MENSTATVFSINDDDSDDRHLSVGGQVLMSVGYMIGIFGNVAALWKLHASETLRNKRQTLMLKCLIYNDFIALFGSFIQMYVQLYSPKEFKISRGFCAVRVFWRIFGFGSGSVAIVMAIERFIALTNPFAYHKNVTYRRIKMSIFTLWGIVALIICLPFFGFGLYYDSKNSKCLRYRDATTVKDIAYAYLVFSYGLVMCLCIVICNLAVVINLCKLSKQSHVNALGKSRHQQSQTDKQDPNKDMRSSTSDEISFAKLMIVLCVFFVICWLPQLFIIIMSQRYPGVKLKIYRMGDIFIAMNFMLDPFFYVLFRHFQQKRLRHLCRPLCMPRCRSTSSSVSDGELNEMNTDKTSTSSKQRQSS